MKLTASIAVRWTNGVLPLLQRGVSVEDYFCHSVRDGFCTCILGGIPIPRTEKRSPPAPAGREERAAKM